MKYETRRLELEIDQIDLTDATFRFRLDFPEEEIEALAKNMKEKGLINPIKVCKKNNKYQIIAGWERLYAAIYLGWVIILAEEYLDISDHDAYNINMIDNHFRNQLSPLETLNMISMMRYGQELPVEEIAELFSYNPQKVYDLLKIQEMKPEIQNALHKGELKLNMAIALHKMPIEKQGEILQTSIHEEWGQRRFNQELRYWRDHPFKDIWNPDTLKRNEGRYHAFKLEIYPDTERCLKSYYEKIGKKLGLPSPYHCETSTTIPAREKGFTCPHMAEWVVTS